MKLSGDPMDIFVHVARMIGELLEVKVVCLSEIRGRELHFLSVYVQGEILINAGHCPLEVTPCATVERSKDLRIYDRVMERFPKATFLRCHNAYSYCGFPSIDNDGRVVAVTCLLDDKPHEFSLEDQELLRIAGQRIGLEIARKRLTDDREATVALLEQSEARLISVLDAAGNFIWEVDTEARFTYLTRGAIEIFGYSIQELLGRTPFEFQFAEDNSWVRDHFFSALREKRQFRGLEHRIRTGTGRVTWVSVSGAPLFDDRRNVSGFRGTVSDVTDRKLAEQALRQSEERLELALQGADLGLWDWDIPSGGVYFNNRWITMLGYTREEIEPRYVQWERLIHPDDKPGVLAVLQAHLAGELRYYEVEHRLRTKEGAWKWVWSSGKVLERDADGIPLRAAGTHLDISVRKALEERLRTQQAELAHAQRLTTAGELAAAIVHELNQPLGAIASYAGAARLEFCEALAAYPGLQSTIDEILRLTRRASGVVRGIRDLVRRREVEVEWVDIRTLVEEILVFTRGEFTRRQIRLVMKIPATTPQVRGDRIQLQQLFLNLIVNAMDAMDVVESGRRKLTLQATPTRANTVTVTLRDTGPGIAPTIMDRLFEPFVTDKAQGIGLGLSLCRTIAEAHGGKISAQSARGQGACFKVSLPIGEGEVPDGH
ncbi:MAG: multi-sensor signal transduction histidine kinase [Proteobacteria bacterium]|nr:multi-sensor signal transduction histidine kinase [Pseudomonadota bacterium]